MAARGFGAFTAVVEPAVRRALLELHRLIQEMHGTFTAQRIRITARNDASHTSTAHGFQIGGDDGANLRIDVNEILATNNGVPATLFIQSDAAQPGVLELGTSANGGTTIDVDDAPFMPAGDNLASAATVSNESGWSTEVTQLRQIGPLVYMHGSTTRTGAAIAVTDAAGNITNQTICTITSNAFNAIDFISNTSQPLQSGATGRLAHFTFNPTTGVLSLVAVAPGADIATNEQWSWGGLIMVHVR